MIFPNSDSPKEVRDSKIEVKCNRALLKENIRLHSEIVEKEVASISINNRVKVLEKEIAKRPSQGENICIYIPYNGKDKNPTRIQMADGTFKMIKIL